MINYKRIGVIFALIAVAFCSLYFFLETRTVNGLLAGHLTGAINFYLIVLTVKNILVKEGGGSAGKAMTAVLIFIGKFFLLGALVAALVILREKYSIIGFLIGFTVSMAAIGIENILKKS